MKFYRCETCGYMLVHDGQFEEHGGHRWRHAGHSTLGEDIKIIGWWTWEKIKKLFGY